MTAAKRVVLLLLLGTVALALALVGNKLLWGFWGFSTPTLRDSAAVKGGLLEAAVLAKVDEPSSLQVVLDGPAVVERRHWVENRVPVTRGFEPWVFEFSGSSRDSTGAIPRPDLDSLWALTRKVEGELSESVEYRASAERGWVLFLKIRSKKATAFVVAHRTSEVANDRYYYGETGFSADGARYAQWGRVHYWFEISNREWFDFRRLLMLSAGLVASIGLLAVVASRSRGNHRPNGDQRVSNTRIGPHTAA